MIAEKQKLAAAIEESNARLDFEESRKHREIDVELEKHAEKIKQHEGEPRYADDDVKSWECVPSFSE